jgi:hypothetical protein
MIPYLGKDENKNKSELQGEYTVKELVQPYLNKGHVVTCDNFFTSQSLANTLRDSKTYLTGTIRKNKKELPSIVRTNGPLHSSIFFEDRQTGSLLTIFQCKSNKNVVVLSNEIDEASVPSQIDLKRKYVRSDTAELFKSNEKKKTSSILAYNDHKAGVDSVDQMTRTYNVKDAGQCKYF